MQSTANSSGERQRRLAGLGVRHDIVIAGGRSAGCVLASRLHEDPSRSVLLIETGPAYPLDAYPPDLTRGSVIAAERLRALGRHGLPKWSFAHALNAHKALENTGEGEDCWHGRSGPWPVHQSTPCELAPPVTAFIDAAAAIGFSSVDDFNGERQEGVGG